MIIEKYLLQIKKKCELEGINISLAESCTGGLVSSSITSIAGSSSFFNSAIISYSNEAKIKLLGVDKKLISKFGAVSEEVSLSMAKNLYKITKSNICISITGVAGPSGGTRFKPVGTVYFTFYIKIGKKIKMLNYKKFFNYKKRKIIQNKSNEFVLKSLLKIIS